MMARAADTTHLDGAVGEALIRQLAAGLVFVHEAVWFTATSSPTICRSGPDGASTILGFDSVRFETDERRLDAVHAALLEVLRQLGEAGAFLPDLRHERRDALRRQDVVGAVGGTKRLDPEG